MIDTNVISETLKSRPDAKVIDWLGDQRPADLFLASMSLGELVRGARRAADKTKRERVERWIDYDLAARFDGRILPFDREAAVIWGEIMGDGDRLGHPKPMADAQLSHTRFAIRSMVVAPDGYFPEMSARASVRNRARAIGSYSICSTETLIGGASSAVSRARVRGC